MGILGHATVSFAAGMRMILEKGKFIWGSWSPRSPRSQSTEANSTALATGWARHHGGEHGGGKKQETKLGSLGSLYVPQGHATMTTSPSHPAWPQSPPGDPGPLRWLSADRLKALTSAPLWTFLPPVTCGLLGDTWSLLLVTRQVMLMLQWPGHWVPSLLPLVRPSHLSVSAAHLGAWSQRAGSQDQGDHPCAGGWVC